jgi:hypothetical protein
MPFKLLLRMLESNVPSNLLATSSLCANRQSIISKDEEIFIMRKDRLSIEAFVYTATLVIGLEMSLSSTKGKK